MHITHSADKPGYFLTREYIDGLVETTFHLKSCKELPILPHEKAYPCKQIPINPLKIKDLKKLNDYIILDDPDVSSFYESIFNWPTAEGRGDESDFEDI